MSGGNSTNINNMDGFIVISIAVIWFFLLYLASSVLAL